MNHTLSEKTKGGSSGGKTEPEVEATQGLDDDEDEPKKKKQFLVNGRAYTKLGLLGQGGSSKVYRVRSETGEILALKKASTTDAGFFQYLRNEVDLLYRLKDQPTSS